MEDLGIIYFKNQDIFIGEVNQTNSIGYLKSKNYEYMGNLIEGKMDGFGHLTSNDLEYVGEFIEDRKNGFFQIFKNQKLYIIGNFQDDKL